MRQIIINCILTGVICVLLMRNNIMSDTPVFWVIMLSVWAIMLNSLL